MIRKLLRFDSCAIARLYSTSFFLNPGSGGHEIKGSSIGPLSVAYML
jgi:hypothetical protein